MRTSRAESIEAGGFPQLPYSVTSNESVCSSCAEFFNVVEDGTRKLVQSCPGAVLFGSAPKNVYIDVKPTRIEV